MLRILGITLLLLGITTQLPAEQKADHIIVNKKARTMELIHAGHVLKTYKIALGRNPVGRKQREGDFRTPEGLYVIDSRNVKSQFHRLLTRTRPTGSEPIDLASRPEETSSFTVCRMATVTSAPHTVSMIGLTAA